MRLYLYAALVIAPVFASAQAPVALIEACNAVPNASKRLACLKLATGGSPAKIQPASAAKQSSAELTISGATTICDSVMTGLQKKRDVAFEDTSLSTAAELVVTWPADEGKSPTYCNVDRSTRKILAFTNNGKVISGPWLAEMERDAIQRVEFKSGNYSNFVARAKVAIAATMKDPASAQFQSLFVSGSALPVLCGEINGKNSYGGFVGFRRFYSTGKPPLGDIENPKESYVFDKMWPSMCGEKVADIN